VPTRWAALDPWVSVVANPVQRHSEGFCLEPTQNGKITVLLIDFTAHIVVDIAEDDGAGPL